jgi:FkbM family methyltransferase
MQSSVKSTKPKYFRDRFSFFSKLLYCCWRLAPRWDFEGTLKNGLRIQIPGNAQGFYDVAWEVFHEEIYALDVDPHSIRRVIDLGGNLGYASLYFAQRFPDSKVIAIEPHPTHCRIFRYQLERNRLDDRIQLIQAAAGSEPGQVFLSDADVSSKLSGNDGTPVSVVDFFEAAGPDAVDLLKIDIEGSEYPLFEDPRFEKWVRGVRWILMEWHDRDPSHRGGAWCAERLRECGFEIESETDTGVGLGNIRARNLQTTGTK